jgi:hypothetical protein
VLVPSILDVIPGPSAQEGSDRNPSRSDLLKLSLDEGLFFISPLDFAVVLEQVIVDSVAALAGRPPGDLARDQRPITAAVLGEEISQRLVFGARETTARTGEGHWRSNSHKCRVQSLRKGDF